MRVRINNGHNQFWRSGQDVTPLKSSDELLLVIDPSKTNMAVLIGTLYDQHKIILEFSGNDTKTVLSEVMDTTDYSYEVNEYLTKLLAGSNLYGVYIEQHIMKKGNDYFNSMTVLTEIRAHLITLGVTLNGKKPEEINNYSWKGDILPDGYRGPNEKGSVRFLQEESPRWIGWTDDVTDAVCIYRHVLKKIQRDVSIKCNAVEESSTIVKMMIIDKTLLPEDVKYFQFNPQYTCEENGIYFANRSPHLGACQLPLNAVSREEIYRYTERVLPGGIPYLVVGR